MKSMTPLTPEEARAQLATAKSLAGRSGKEARIGAITTAGIGVLVAGAAVLCGLFANTNTAAFLIGMVGYAAGIIALMVWHSRRVRVADRGWNRRHFSSFVLTMVLYSIGIAWVGDGSPSWALFGPYCVLVGLPMVLAASRTARR
jgi:uncharacterized membrane protein HdeD (DUF308 family)